MTELSRPGVSLIPIARNRKLAPVEESRSIKGWTRFRAIGPYCAATYVSIQSTCPDVCRFKNGNGCFAEAGYMGPLVRALDEASKGLTPALVAANEAAVIDAFGPVPSDGGKHGKSGRDLRLHISGDAFDTESAQILAGAAERWKQRGGGAVWAYTHSWREIPVEAWGTIAILASCETPEDVKRARARGYAPSIVVRDFRGAQRAHALPEISGRVLPCPAETRNTTCVQCRLCFDVKGLKDRELVIGFSAHGRDAEKARRRLPILDSLFGNLA